jgi:hypothetical protein
VALALSCASVAGAQDSSSRPALEVRHPHELTRAEARVRMDQLLDYWAKRFGVQRAWDGDRVVVQGRFWGMDFRALLVIRDREVQAVADDPGTPLRRTAVNYVNGKLRKYLHPHYEG